MENTTQEEKTTTPKHVFLHLFVIIMLYASTINFVTLLFQYINYWVADPLLRTSYSISYNADLIRFGIAALIIIFPVFILSSKFLNSSYLKNAAIREMRIRKWLIYFTLFVSALIIVGDLVGIILSFLNGEATLRFILKALTILSVTGLIFFYYLGDLRDSVSSKNIKIFVWGVIGAVTVAIITGFFVVGSPSVSRAIRFDNERTANLQEAQYQIINYWQNKGKLPATLGNLTDSISGYKTPTDPETGTAYEYSVTGTTTFKLCANFNLASDANNPNSMQTGAIYAPYPNGKVDNWSHEKGRTCFDRTIDPEIYKQFDKIK
ncbi:MAG: DUF5671 domain-containing protein [Patescibacteria group bacterium]|jgi:hypothetical protein